MFRAAFYVIGLLSCLLASVMLVPAAVDYSGGNPDWQIFVASAGVVLFLGGTVAFSTRSNHFEMRPRTGFLITVGSWFAAIAIGALPLMLGSLHLSLTDAVFESVSGLTTTGATVLHGLDNMPPGILLWRSLLQWIGGAGIVVMAIFMLPFLRVGGMQLYQTESSDVSEKVAPRIYQVAGLTVMIYGLLTVACTIALVMAGMTLFDAVNHAMAALATGGFSTKDASVGYFHSLPIELVLIVFMTAGALPLVFYARLVNEGRKAFVSEPQVMAFLSILLVAIAAVTIWRFVTSTAPLAEALRQSAFNVTSIITDTGFATTDYSKWGTGAHALFLLIMFVGGCAGSTAGAIKVFRWQVLFAAFRSNLKRSLSPHRVVVTRYGGRQLDPDTVASVRNFFFMYMMTWAALSTALMFSGLDLLTSTSSVAQAMANAGPGLGPVVGPATNFDSIPTVSKWLLSLAMLLGRLELTTVYMLLLPDFWRE